MISITRVLLGALLLCGAAVVHAADDLLEAMPELSPAPAFDLQTPDGTRVLLSELRGEVVVVNFWATWCPPCLAEMPAMERAWQGLRDKGVRFIGINVDEDSDTVAKFAETHGVSFPLLIDPGGKVTQAWPLRGLPTTFVVDAEGRLRFRALGERNWDDQPIMQQILSLTENLADLPATDQDAPGW
jgi:peroxiredoxin